MFPIDTAILPSLTTRKALLVVDPQNDFLSEDGALPVNIPMDLPERISDFANAFRQNGGEVIWVQSRFESTRPASSEQILTSMTPTHPGSSGPARSRRPRPPPQMLDRGDCPEAFLTEGEPELPKCVRQGTPGIEMHPTIKQAVGPKDPVLFKSHYSAFKSKQLLQLLRIKFVTEIFICGAFTNIGIMATAVDAASHGYAMTIVEDCCGYQSMTRHRCAIRQMTETTGCDVLASSDVLESLTPMAKQPQNPERRSSMAAASRYPTVRHHHGAEDGHVSPASQIQSSFEKLSLSVEPVANKPELQAHAKKPNAPLQSVGECAPQTEKQTNRDVLASERSPVPDDSNANLDIKPREADSHEAAQAPTRGQATSLQASTELQIDTEHETDPHRSRLKGEESPSTAETSRFWSSNDTSDSSEEAPTPISKMANAQESEGTANGTRDCDSTQNATQDSTQDSTCADGKASTLEASDANPSESDPLCEGDTKVIYDVLPPTLAENIFERIRDEVLWQRMSHQGGEVPRLVAVQGQIDEDGTMPVYRHPADESPPLLPFSPTVAEIRRVIEDRLGHPLNHVLIQFYRDGNDYISEHSDKTLDIVKGSFIANVSLGAERTMTLRTKRPPKEKNTSVEEPGSSGPKRQVQRARLPHNSLCRMGLVTNMRWLHGIRQDKRLDREKSEAELAYDGGRISLTFRQIGTFLDRDNKLIWGQGAKAKSKEQAHEVVNGQTPEAVRMLQGFGRENQSTDFDWAACYGEGFDVLHISTASRLFLSSDPVVNMRIQLMLAEYGISYARGSMSPHFNWKDGKPTRDPAAIPEDLPIKFVDNDVSKTTIQGQLGIMLYLERTHDPARSAQLSPPELARQLGRFQQGLSLLDKYRACPDPTDIKALSRELGTWDTHAREAGKFIAGSAMSLADFAFWPVLHTIVSAAGEEFNYKDLTAYYERIKARASGAQVLSSTTTSPSS
ncbi:hypothetical protein F5X96DRAFT_37051 [Biscogniauxia mediterranea]|nr:hypothetical protein F5X96DRAFT_37051 [Biscogniauxia mediterranea]